MDVDNEPGVHGLHKYLADIMTIGGLIKVSRLQ